MLSIHKNKFTKLYLKYNHAGLRHSKLPGKNVMNVEPLRFGFPGLMT